MAYETVCAYARNIGAHLATPKTSVDEENSIWDGVEEVEARYANSFRVGYNAFEILLDFGQVSSQTGRPRLQSRIITSPGLASALFGMLEESLKQYRDEFGPIPEETKR